MGHQLWLVILLDDLTAKEMKVKLLTGEDSILTPPPKIKRDVFLPEVAKIAKQHWQDTTIPEPSVRRRMRKKEGKLQEGERGNCKRERGQTRVK